MNIKYKALNVQNPSETSLNFRNKVVEALLYENLDGNLGFTGGQCNSMIKSILINTKLFDEESRKICLENSCLYDVFENFLNNLKQNAETENIINDIEEKGISLGVMPLIIATFLYGVKRQADFLKNNIKINLTAEVLHEIVNNPSDYTIIYKPINEDEKQYVSELERIFEIFIDNSEKRICDYSHISNAMLRWYLSLSNYSKSFISGQDAEIIKNIKKAEVNSKFLIFEKIPAVYDCSLKEAAELTESLIMRLVQADTDLYNFIRNTLNENDEYAKYIKNNEYSNNAENIAKAVTGLYPSDWNTETAEHFKDNLNKHIKKSQRIKPFAKQQIIDYSGKAKLLYNEIYYAVTEMGDSIDAAEKVRVLKGILEEIDNENSIFQ